MTQPTTAECIEWLTRWLDQYSQIVPPDNEAFVIQTAILAKLLAADEMAKALDEIANDDHYPFEKGIIAIIKKAQKALKPWSENRGE